MYLVINVDGLGLHPAVRRAAQRLASAGRATSASLVANGPDFESSLTVAGLALGVHLNVVHGRPLSGQADVSTMITSKGRFLNNPEELFRRHLDGKLSVNQLETEWTAQLARVADAGIRPTHLTSMGSVLSWPGIMPLAVDLARRFGVRWIRRPESCESVMDGGQPGLMGRFLNICSMLRRKPDTVGWPGLVLGQEGTMQRLSADRFQEYVREAGSIRVVEIGVCPGEQRPGDPPLSADFIGVREMRQWPHHLRELSDPAWDRILSDPSIVLSDYGDLDPKELGLVAQT